MVKKRWVLIFIGLCLVLAFSVSSVEAQQNCDRDGDGWFKDTNKCDGMAEFGPDPDDNDCRIPITDSTACGAPEPPPDDGGNKGTPVKVTFDDVGTDSIQSDGVFYAHDESKTGVLAILDGGFFMNMRAGGDRKLFIDFGDIVDCDSGDLTPVTPFGDCVLDARFNPGSFEGIVECPFPQDFNVRGMQNGYLTDTVCSALVKAALWEHDAFEGDPDPEVLAHIEDMYPGNPCPGKGCGGPIIKVRPFQDRDIEFNVPSPKGKKFNGWSITFSDKKGHCSGQVPPAGHFFPDFLSIRAFDMDDGVGGARGADTWKIGTGVDEPRLACLVKHKGDEFVGFFEMSFMYTVVILEPAP